MKTEDQINYELDALSFRAGLIYRNLCRSEVTKPDGLTMLEIARQVNGRDAVSWLDRAAMGELQRANLVTFVGGYDDEDPDARFITID